jgi:uroporphyrin-3 C-methyltransferase
MSDKSEKPAEESAKSTGTVQSDKEAPGKDIVEQAKVESAKTRPAKKNNNPTGEKPVEDKPAKKETEKTPPQPRRKIPWFGLFNFLLIIALIAAAAYYWQQQQKIEAEKLAAFDNLKQQVATKAESNQLQSELRPLESGLTDLDKRLEQLQEQQQAIQESTETLYELFGRDENGWKLAEVEYLMRIAQHKLILENDFEGAAATLQAASNRIADTGDLGLLPVRVQISEEIAELKTRRRPDLVGMTLKLSQLGQQVRSLTPGFIAQPVDSPNAEVIDDVAANLPDRVRNFLSSLVSVKSGVDMPPTNTEALIINISEKLEDNLKLTRWSVLERDAFQYKRLMKENVELFEQFYNLDDAANNDFYSQLQSLQKAEIKPEKPDISGSQQMLRKIITKRENADQELNNGDGDNV